jgi:hypothetical protein
MMYVLGPCQSDMVADDVGVMWGWSDEVECRLSDEGGVSRLKETVVVFICYCRPSEAKAKMLGMEQVPSESVRPLLSICTCSTIL